MVKRELQAQGEYYHICGRGNMKQTLFKDSRDYLRFIFNILHFQSDKSFYNISRYINYFQESKSFKIPDSDIDQILENRNVELTAFCLMPNHYHLILKNISKRGISSYMQRVLTAFSNYFNSKYQSSGHVFEGAYNLIHISSDRQLQYLFTYIHKNPRELQGWTNNYWDYPWSSCYDFNDNRWERLLTDSILRDQFDTYPEYIMYLNESSAKTEFEPPVI